MLPHEQSGTSLQGVGMHFWVDLPNQGVGSHVTVMPRFDAIAISFARRDAACMDGVRGSLDLETEQTVILGTLQTVQDF